VPFCWLYGTTEQLAKKIQIRTQAEQNRRPAAKAAMHFATLSGTTKVVPFQNKDSS
jgi:hypothetical protein